MSRRDEGFSVVETLMALVVVGSVSLALTQALISARSMAEESRARSEALRLAQLGLEHSRRSIDPADAMTDRPWRLHQRPDPRTGLMRYEIRVPWAAGRKTGEVRLITYDWEGERHGE